MSLWECVGRCEKKLICGDERTDGLCERIILLEDNNYFLNFCR